MLKLIKWDIINFIKNYYAYYILFGIVLLLALVFPVNNNYSDIVAMICSVTGGILFGISVLYLIGLTFLWLNKETSILESSISTKPWKFLLSKMLSLVLIQLVNCILTILLSFVLSKFATENTSYLSLTFSNPIIPLIWYLFIVNIVVLSDFLARNISSKHHGFFAIMIFIAIAIILLYVFAIYLKLTGSADVTFYGLSISVQNESNSLARYIFSILITIGFFIINSNLLKKRIDV